MKKVSFIVLMLLSAVCLVACNSPSTIEGEFLSKEYVLSLDEVKDFYDEVKIKGIEKEKIILASSNDKILSSDDGKEFKAISSGKAYIFAKYKNKTVAKAKVNVKYKLSSPQNFALSEEGILTWDKSYAVINGEKILASEYKVEVGQIVDMASEIEYQQQIISEPTITLPKKASYSVKVTAISDNDKLENSQEISRVFHNGVMGVLEDVTFEVSDEFASQEASILWATKVNAEYDVYVEGFKLASGLKESRFDFDYSRFNGGKVVNVEVVAKDSNGEKLSSSTNLEVNILNVPNLQYFFDKEATLKWDRNFNATSHKLRVSSYEGEVTFIDVEDIAIVEEKLNGYAENIYEVSLMSVGGETNGKFYVSSAVSTGIRIAKIAPPEVSVEFVDNKANVTFTQNDYVTNYKISYNSFSTYYSTEMGLTTTIPMFGIPVGEYNIEIVALPKADTGSETGVKVYNYKNDSTNKVLDSNKLTTSFYVLESIGEITHTLSGNTSTFTFPAVENANYYKLFVNDIEITANIFEENGTVICRMTDLNLREPLNGGYDIKIIAGHKDAITEKDIAVCSQKIKRIEILDAPQEELSFDNGTFKWKDLSEDCVYSYELFKTESDYLLATDQTPILAESNIDALEIAETLDEGYYKIRVKSISKDKNLYFDCDFYDENNILEVDFYVTKNIAQPTAEFFVDGEDYKLTINTVEHASLYQIYVDGVLDGQINSDGLAQEQYIFGNEFTSVGKHRVNVKALAGNKNDGTIYLPSTEFELNVNRLSLPNYVVNVIYSEFDSSNHQWLTVSEIANTESVEFYHNGSKKDSEEYRLDIVDYNTYGSEFKIGMILKAGASQGNEYYIDSHLKEVDFARANYPIDIKYTNGVLSWTQTQSEANKNYLSIIVDTATGSDYYHRDTNINGINGQLNLQSYINNLRATDITFDTAYRQVEKLQVKMLSYMNGESDKFYLPSFYGTTSGGTNSLDINLLETPEISFDIETKILSWEYDVEGSVFDIYANDVLVKEGYDLKNISLADIGIDFTTQRKLTIRARESSHLNSDISNAVYIKELTTPNNISVIKDGTNCRVNILITSDSANISSVYVNGSSQNVNYVEGGNIASFNVADFAGTTDFAINLIAKNESSTNYYISSTPRTFTLSSLANETFVATVESDKIVWTELGVDMMGNNIFPLRYVLTFTNNEDTFTKTFYNQTELQLSELETIARKTLNGEIKLNIKAIVTEDYILTSGENVAKGYYGEIASEQLTTNRLASVTDVNTQVVDGSGATEIERKTNSTYKVSFKDNWSAFAEVKFSIKVKSTTIPLDLILSNEGVTASNYTFEKVNQNYEFTLTNDTVKLLNSGNTEITIQAVCDKQISSDIYSFNIEKFTRTSNGEVSDDGILTVKDSQENASYLVEISIEDAILESKVLYSNKTLNLMTDELLLNRFGAYIVKLLTFDENNIKIPANEFITFTGYKLQGIENVYITDEGDIIFDVYMDDLEDVVFSAKCNEITKEIYPTLVEDKTNQYKIPMLDLLNVFGEEFELIEDEYSFEFAVRSEGSMDSDWKELVFNYAIDQSPVLIRGRDLDKDYIIFALSDKSDTISFRMEATAEFPELITDEEGNTQTIKTLSTQFTSIPAGSVLGFWVTDIDGKNGCFVTEKGSESDLIYTECYALCLNTMLTGLDYGWVEINISRIGKLDGVYYQYNQSYFKEYKLNKINDEEKAVGTLTVKDNYLTFSWAQQDGDASARNMVPTAYYVDFVSSDGTQIKRVITFVCSLDLRTAGLIAGVSYDIYVKALSAQKTVLASNESQSVATLKYTTPVILEVKEGVLAFDAEEFKKTEFMQDIINYFAQTTENIVYHNEYGIKQYTSPYFFTPSLLDELYVTLRFTKLDSTGGVTNQVYTTTILGYWLFPDFSIDFNLVEFEEIGQAKNASYYTLLNKYSGRKLSGATSTEATNIRSMIEALMTSPRGIGDDAILIDDIGRTIPAGDYHVSVIQTKSNQFIESTNSPTVHMYLTAAPQVSLQTAVKDNITQYTVDVTPSATMIYDYSALEYKLDATMRYKLSLRPVETLGTNVTAGIRNAIIVYDKSLGQWTISYNGTIIDGVISNNDLKANLGIPGFTLNMSAFRKAVNTLTGEETILANSLMRADIFAYAQNNGYVLNGKSGIFNIRYLDLSADSITFQGGQFIINSTLDSSYELLVKYKLASAGQTSFTTKFVNNEAVLDFEKEGIYEYVILSLNGSISSNTMNIESSSYAITNLYKLSAPTLSTSNSNMLIRYNSLDLAYMNTLEFNMANNVSLDAEYSSDLSTAPDKGYYYQSHITSAGSLAPYVVGSKDTNGTTIYPSELSASTFYAFLNGNNGTFTLSEESHAMADYLLIFSEDWAIMTSKETSINARMLNVIEKYEISEGNLIIDDRHIGINIVSDADKNYLSGNLVYEVVIDFYIQDNVNPADKILVGSETIYSERRYASDTEYIAQVFDGLNFNTKYDYFKVSVTILGGLRVDATTPNAIKTVEGSYVLLKDSAYFYNDGAHVLRSQTYTSENLIQRTNSVYLASGSKGVRSGKINFVINNKDDLIYYGDTMAGADIDTARRILIFAEYTQGGTTYLDRIYGIFEFHTSSAVGEEDNVYVGFTPTEGQLNNIVGAFTIKIYAYGKGTVISKAFNIENVYKLQNITSKYYSIGLDTNANTYINLSNYFDSVSISSDNKCYKLHIYYSGDKHYILSSNDSSQRFVIPSDATYVSIQAVDGQSETEANSKKLLYSDRTSFDVEKTSVEGLNLIWNSQTMRFEWSWPEGNEDDYEYYVTIKVGNKITTETVTTNYYQPRDRGLIGTGGFELRARKLGEESTNTLSTFSDKVSYQGEEILYDIYSGGNGTKSNPYLIRNEIDFFNMSKRNTSDFYFRLDSDSLSIDITSLMQGAEGEQLMIMEDFNAHFDGNGYTIEIVSSTSFALAENYAPNLIGKPNVEFSEYSSLFRNLSPNASISNLFIDYVIDYTDLSNSNIMFAPLCAFNYGTIDNVKISSVTINLDGQGDSNTALVGGIVGVNYGTIKNCINSAEINYTMAQQLNITFGYAGIALFNVNNTTFVGSIENCFNQGTKNISVTVNNNLVYLAGITLTNNGKISKAGNDGQLILSAKSGVTAMTGYYAGIVVANNNGTLEYVYNNALIQKTTSYGTFNYGGVAYTVSSGKINTLVVTVSGQPLVMSCSNRPTDVGSNYSSSDSGTSSNISTKTLSAQVIDCGEGFTLAITETVDGWKASITKD